MTTPSDASKGVVLLVGAGQPLAVAIAERLGRADLRIVTTTGASQAAVADALARVPVLQFLVIVPPPPVLGTAVLDVDDHQLEGALGAFLDLFGALHQSLPRLVDGGGVLVVISRGYLGGWDGAHEMAFSGAVVGLMRSVALENMARGVRANVIAVELPGSGAPSDPIEVADLAHYLLSPAAAAVNGELILGNGGRSLQIREAKDRRPPLAQPTRTEPRFTGSQ